MPKSPSRSPERIRARNERFNAKLKADPVRLEAYQQKARAKYLRLKETDPEKLKRYSLTARAKNPEKIRARNREWKKNHKDQVLADQREASRRRRLEDPSYRILGNMRAVARNVLRGIASATQCVRHMGCTVEQLKAHLEAQFLPGMTWDNYGFFGWHIDHVRPLSKFDLTKEEQRLDAFHYTNLQPLWRLQNNSKGNHHSKRNFEMALIS